MKIFTAHTTYPYKTDEGMREMSLTTDFTADDLEAAVMAAVRHGRNRVQNLKGGPTPDLFLGSIKVSEKDVGPIDVLGDSTTRTGFPFFEWKYDTGSCRSPRTSLEETVLSFSHKFSQEK